MWKIKNKIINRKSNSYLIKFSLYHLMPIHMGQIKESFQGFWNAFNQ